MISQAFQKYVMIQLTSPNKTLSLGFQGLVEPKRDNHQGHTPKDVKNYVSGQLEMNQSNPKCRAYRQHFRGKISATLRFVEVF